LYYEVLKFIIHKNKNICKTNHKYINCSIVRAFITIKKDLDSITSILQETLITIPFKRDYDSSFGKIATILRRYDLNENPSNLRFRFTLCMQEFFDSIPQDQWNIKDPEFINQSEEFAIKKFDEWILAQIT